MASIIVGAVLTSIVITGTIWLAAGPNDMRGLVGISLGTFASLMMLGQTIGQVIRRERDRAYPCEGAEYGVCGGVPHTRDCPSYVDQSASTPGLGIHPRDPGSR